MSAGAQPRIGTSGWVYKHWNGIFYPPGMSSAELLRFYAARFDTVEVNFSFYRLPERKVFEQWRAQTPDDFLFAVKGSRYLTHMKKLKDPDEPLHRLLDHAEGLGEKLGPILFQFPHTWHADVERLGHFLVALHAHSGHRYAFEFRHKTWLVPEVYALLEQEHVALCLPVDPELPLDVRLTAPWTYIRMHRGQRGTGYTEGELEAWARHIRSFRDQQADIYVYFNNDPEGHAIRDAERLRLLLG